MALISSWITNILLLILFATILELLLPNSSTHRYVKLVVGLMLLVAMLQPVLSIFQKDPEKLMEQMDMWEEESYEDDLNDIELEKSDIETESLAYISEQVAVQLKEEAQAKLIEEFEKKIMDLKVSFHSLHEQENIDNLESIQVTIQDASMEDEYEDELGSDIQIDTIIVESEAPPKNKGDMEGNKQMKNRLADLWQVPEDVIFISDKGGRSR